ncbi:hypothetical protein [Mycoplasmoides alvi]|uniref:hypothetical protein n=1 Tax=Mycoplasmoides alvi TaxID=78580 RepID=UPI00051C8684|nr:hypothetical protein [Mycoplasmoides alvi]
MDLPNHNLNTECKSTFYTAIVFVVFEIICFVSLICLLIVIISINGKSLTDITNTINGNEIITTTTLNNNGIVTIIFFMSSIIFGILSFIVAIIFVIKINASKTYIKPSGETYFILGIIGIFIPFIGLISACMTINYFRKNKKKFIEYNENSSFTNAICIKCEKIYSIDKMLKTLLINEGCEKIVYSCHQCASNN